MTERELAEIGGIICRSCYNGVCLIDGRTCYGICEMPKADEIYKIMCRKADEARKETAREIFQQVVNILKNEEDFQDGSKNTQLMPLYVGIANGCAFIRGQVKELAKEYGVEEEE